MAWSTPLVAVSNSTLTAAQWNASVQANLLETAPAKATAAGQIFVATGTNAIAARPPTVASDSSSSTTTSTTYTDLVAGAGPSLSVTTGTMALVMVNCRLTTSTATAEAYAGFAITVGTPLSASDSLAVMYQPGSGGAMLR